MREHCKGARGREEREGRGERQRWNAKESAELPVCASGCPSMHALAYMPTQQDMQHLQSIECFRTALRTAPHGHDGWDGVWGAGHWADWLPAEGRGRKPGAAPPLPLWLWPFQVGACVHLWGRARTCMPVRMNLCMFKGRLAMCVSGHPRPCICMHADAWLQCTCHKASPLSADVEDRQTLVHIPIALLYLNAFLLPLLISPQLQCISCMYRLLPGECPASWTDYSCRDEVSYDLGQRGLRVITGKNNDDPASDSNGAGKSALVMAPLWAITGRTEPRSEVRAIIGLCPWGEGYMHVGVCHLCVRASQAICW